VILPTDARCVELVAALDGQRLEVCELCRGTGWVEFPDPFVGDAHLDARCPCGLQPYDQPTLFDLPISGRPIETLGGL
jgi:hypothetical protein